MVFGHSRVHTETRETSAHRARAPQLQRADGRGRTSGPAHVVPARPRRTPHARNLPFRFRTTSQSKVSAAAARDPTSTQSRCPAPRPARISIYLAGPSHTSASAASKVDVIAGSTPVESRLAGRQRPPRRPPRRRAPCIPSTYRHAELEAAPSAPQSVSMQQSPRPCLTVPGAAPVHDELIAPPAAASSIVQMWELEVAHPIARAAISAPEYISRVLHRW